MGIRYALLDVSVDNEIWHVRLRPYRMGFRPGLAVYSQFAFDL